MPTNTKFRTKTIIVQRTQVLFCNISKRSGRIFLLQYEFDRHLGEANASLVNLLIRMHYVREFILVNYYEATTTDIALLQICLYLYR